MLFKHSSDYGDEHQIRGKNVNPFNLPESLKPRDLFRIYNHFLLIQIIIVGKLVLIIYSSIMYDYSIACMHYYIT